MKQTPKLLIVGPDAKLPAECSAALRGIPDLKPVTHAVGDYRQGVEAARSRRPDLALVEMGPDLRPLMAFAEEVAVGSPETVVAAVFAPDAFGSDVSESAILIEAMRAGVRDFIRRPVSRADLEQLLRRHLHRPTARQARAGRVVSFLSNKGGVGKSTLAVNTACELAARHPEQVLLIDASLQMGVCASLLDLQPVASLTDAVRERHRLDEVLVRQLATPHESGLHLLSAPANALEAAEVDDELMARVLTLGRRAYDFVLVDSFPLMDRVMMAVLDLSDRAYLVFDGLVPTVLGAAQFLATLDGLGFPRERQRLVLNRHASFPGALTPGDVARRLGREIDHVLPYEKRLLPAANLGRPYILGAGRWFAPWAAGLRRLGAAVEGVKPGKRASRPKRNIEPSANGTSDTKQVQP